MSKSCFVFLALLVAASFASAQNPEPQPLPIKSVKEVAGEAFLPVAMSKHSGWGGGCQPVDDKPHAWKSEGVVIAETNQEMCESFVCVEPYEEMVVVTPSGAELVFWRAPLHRLQFKPKKWHPKYLEIIWSGMINVYSGYEQPSASQFQTAFLECTVTQKGCTVPCSGTDWIPAIAQDLTQKGLSEWVTYHGYANINPSHEVTVELWLWSWPWEGYAGLVNACCDTVTLKY